MAAMICVHGRCLSRTLVPVCLRRSLFTLIKEQTSSPYHCYSGVSRLSSHCYYKDNFTPNATVSQLDRKSLTPCGRFTFHSSPIYFNSSVIKVPPFAESISEGDIRWDKGVGDTVAIDEVVCEIETDKTSIPVNAPFAGVIEELLVEDGATVTAGTPLFKITSSEGGAPSKKSTELKPETPKQPHDEPSPPKPTPTPVPPPEEPAPKLQEPIPTVPPVPPTSVPPPGEPMSKTPIESITPKPYKPPSPAVTSGGPPPGSQITGTRTEQRVKMNRMRLRIGQRLKDAQNTNAMLTTFNEIDMSNMKEMRSVHKDAFLKKHNLKLGFMSAFVKAAAYALQDQPVVNGVIDETDVVYRDYIDISVAVATPKGLVVPVIRNVEKMNFADVEKTINALGEKARTGSLAIEDMDGGTFTISNGGVFGSMFGTPIINPPQSAILGMHAIFDRPVAINGKVEIRPMMYVALTYDHRLIDGREAVFFLKKIKQTVEDPRILLLDV